MSLTSCLYECEIAHARTTPRAHSFVYRHFMFYIALDEVELFSTQMRMIGKHKLSPYRFELTDHLPEMANIESLLERVKQFVRKAGCNEQVSTVHLLTNVRFLGYVFNPISFFFCFDKTGNPVCCLVEVGNTFGEKKAYLLRGRGDGVFYDRQKKLFYISPFTELAQDVVFDLSLPAEKLCMKVDTLAGPEKVVSTYLTGKRLSLTDENLLALTVRYPWAPARVILLIHLHAFLLWLKRVPYHRKEENIEQQIAVMNPHVSLRHNLRR